MSTRHNLSVADQQFIGRAGYANYNQGKPGVELAVLSRFRPTGNRAMVFTAVVPIGAVSATLNGNWAGATGFGTLTFDDGTAVLGYAVNGTTPVLFFNPQPPTYGQNYATYAVNSQKGVNATIANQPPVVSVAAAFAASQSIGAAGLALLNGAAPYVAAGVGVPDVARNVIGAWTTASTVTVTGTDAYGAAQTEAQTGTAFTGKKAFMTITKITSSAAITAATFGFGNVLGLPFRVSSGGFFAPTFDDAADAGTFVKPDLTMPATATTGDVRGTYAPAGTLNGAKYVGALIMPSNPATVIGAFGVTPA